MPNGRTFLGEVVISPKRAERYARQFGISFPTELFRYVCHGILHLKGYSDDSARLQNRMRKLENQLMAPLHLRIEKLSRGL